MVERNKSDHEQAPSGFGRISWFGMLLWIALLFFIAGVIAYRLASPFFHHG